MTVITYLCHYPELCKSPAIKKPCHTCRLYAQGRLVPKYPVPAVWKHHRFTVDFHFYVQRGFVNAMFDAAIERVKNASSSD